MLPRKYRLNSDRDFKIVFKYGRKVRGRFGMLIVLPPKGPTPGRVTSNVLLSKGLNFNETGSATRPPTPYPPKFGFIVSKKQGNAVKRHLMARRLRSLAEAAIKEHGDRLNNLRFSYIAYSYAEDFNDLKRDFEEMLRKALHSLHITK